MPWKACETSRYRVSLWTFLPWNPWGYFKPNHNYGSIGSIIRQPATVEPTTITMMAPWHKPRISFWNQTTRNRKNLLRTSTYLRWNEHGGLFMIFPQKKTYDQLFFSMFNLYMIPETNKNLNRIFVNFYKYFSIYIFINIFLYEKHISIKYYK